MNFCLQCHDQATWGLMSLWQMPFEWMYARDLEVNRVHTCPGQSFKCQNTQKVNISQPEELVHVELDEGDRNGLLLLAILSCHLKDDIDEKVLK